MLSLSRTSYLTSMVMDICNHRKEWWRSIKGRKAYALFSWHDPTPFLYDLYNGIQTFLSLQEQKERDHRNPLDETEKALDKNQFKRHHKISPITDKLLKSE